MSEFANTELFLEGGTKKSRDFFNEWFKKVNLTNLKDQYFREYYRSGNIFLYRLDGKFRDEDFAELIRKSSPIALSRALCRPTSSATDKSSNSSE